MLRKPRLSSRQELRLPRPRRWARRRLRSGRNLGIAACVSLAITAAAWPEFSPSFLGPPAPTTVGVARVLDGDTLEIRGQGIRLHGIDAPESGQFCRDAAGREWRCGQRAALELQDLIGRRTVVCDQRDIDRYGRIVARCLVGEVDVARQLALQGLAVAYLRYSWRYLLPQIRAWAANRGMWAGDFEAPERWRRGR